jgi:hypothetical protein
MISEVAVREDVVELGAEILKVIGSLHDEIV